MNFSSQIVEHSILDKDKTFILKTDHTTIEQRVLA